MELSKKEKHILLQRVFDVANVSSSVELAELLDLSPSAISRAKGRGEIPSSWYRKLIELGKDVDIMYILTGVKKDKPCPPTTSAPRAVLACQKIESRELGRELIQGLHYLSEHHPKQFQYLLVDTLRAIDAAKEEKVQPVKKAG